jgi:hypothetical protein
MDAVLISSAYSWKNGKYFDNDKNVHVLLFIYRGSWVGSSTSPSQNTRLKPHALHGSFQS